MACSVCVVECVEHMAKGSGGTATATTDDCSLTRPMEDRADRSGERRDWRCWQGPPAIRDRRRLAAIRARVYLDATANRIRTGSGREEMVELRGFEPLTPRLPALCSPN